MQLPLSRALAVVLASAAIAAVLPVRAADPAKVFRYAFPIAETSLDPIKGIDLYSGALTSAIFDVPLKYDYLARPVKLKPNTLASMPEISADGLTYTLRVKPGIHFDDHPAFKGRKRELVAEDYVYSMKRLLDPKLAAQMLSQLEGYVAGVDGALAKARKENRLDYDAPITGLRALDRYTFQIILVKPYYNFIYNFADCRVTCAVAREVVEQHGDDIGAHPVGTGPFRLAFWKRSSKLVFEPNPNYREEYFDGEPAADDAIGQAVLATMRGKRLPLVGKVEVYIIEETQPRWLAFLNEELDLAYEVPPDFANVAFPNNRLAPNLQKAGIGMAQEPGLDVTFAFFNMQDLVVGGYAPENVALRRAISLGYNTRDEIAIVWKGQAIPAHTPYSPGVAGYDPTFRTSASEHSVPKARALLDLYGYVDRDGDGYRELPDGRPLTIEMASTPSLRDQNFDELWKRSMDDIGVRMTFRKAKWPDLLKEAYAGKLMMWKLGGAAAAPDADTWLASLYGPNAGLKGNIAQFRLDAYDRLYERAQAMPDSPGRTKLYQEMARLVVAYAPWKVNTHRTLTDLWHPWVIGFRRQAVQSDMFWKYIDIDNSKRASASH
jgi:ABC-type transport system substrate-binding protein